ncbi:hypothetical protein D9M72_633470 [compost metagenome]
MDDQTIEKMREDIVAARVEVRFVIALEEGDGILLVDLHSAQASDVGDAGVADIEHVAHAAQYIVVDHRVFLGSMAQRPVQE